MFGFSPSPLWFYGVDSAFEIVTTIVCISIALFSYKIYRFTEARTYKLVTYAFIAISFSYLIKAVTNLKVFAETIQLDNIVTVETYTKLISIYQLGHISYRLLYIMGLILLLILALNITCKRTMSIIAILSAIAIIFSYNYQPMFHIVSAIFLFYIFTHFHQNAKKKKTRTSKLIAISFLLQFISQIFFIFKDPLYYVGGELILFTGYIILSYYIILVSK